MEFDMKLDILAKNIKYLRNLNRISQNQLAKEANISLPTIKNLESKKNMPSVEIIQKIAKVFNVRIYDLFNKPKTLNFVRFRSTKHMRIRENILAEVAIWLNNYNYLEKCLNEKKGFKLFAIREKCLNVSPAEAAELCRKSLGIKPTDPINDICDLLEEAGIKVHLISKASDDFFGLSIMENDGGPAIVVNIYNKITVERRIYSAAHELGHLMLHPEAYDVNKIENNEKEEKEADIFASHFLMSDEGFSNEWNKAIGKPFVDRILKIKSYF